MTAGVHSPSREPSAHFPFDAVLSRCLVWHDQESNRRIAILSEPTNDSLTAQRAAEAVIIRLWESLREYRNSDLADAALRAMANAHQTVRKANLLPGGQRRSDLGLVGVTLCLIEGNQMIVALAAPAQILVLQDAQIFPVPSLDLRSARHGFGDAEVGSLPLGGGGFRPSLFVTQVEPGDRVMICSNGVSRQLAALVQDYPGRLQNRLAGIMRDEPLVAEPKLRELLGTARSNLLAVFAPADALTPDGEVRHTIVRNAEPASVTMGSRISSAPLTSLNPQTPSPARATTQRTVAPVLATDKPAGIAPLSNQVFTRYVRHSSPLREALRVWVPRGPWEAIPLWSVGLVILLLLAFGGGARWYQYEQDRQTQADRYLAEADLQLSTLGVSTDRDVLREQVAAAQEALESARENGATEEELDERQEELVAARDRIDGVQRLEDVLMVGTLPTGLRQENQPKLVRSGDSVYLIDGAVFRLDRSTGQLVQILTPGIKTDRVTPGTIIDGTSDGETLIVTDGKVIFKLLPGDEWDAKRLGLRESGDRWTATSVASFDGAWYLLNGDAGTILRFDPETLDQVPSDWTQGEHRERLAGAVDFMIDGSIYVVTDEDRFVVLYRGELQESDDFPTIQNPIAIYGGLDTAFIWVLETVGETPTLLRIERGAFETVTYQLPFDWDGDAGLGELAGIRDMVVLEGRGEVLFVTDTSVWRASIPQA